MIRIQNLESIEILNQHSDQYKVYNVRIFVSDNVRTCWASLQRSPNQIPYLVYLSGIRSRHYILHGEFPHNCYKLKTFLDITINLTKKID